MHLCFFILVVTHFHTFNLLVYLSIKKTPPRKTEQELKEEEELHLALALSQSEAESKKQQQQKQVSLFVYVITRRL